MPQIPVTEHPVLLRTDFSNDAAWEAVCAAIQQPVGEFKAHMEYVSDLDFEDASTRQILSLIPDEYPHDFICIADGTALSHPESAVLVVDLVDDRGREFRAIPSEMWGIENNLSIANMFFSEFADAVDADGVFRGFPMG